jgi:hypothetical protein
VQRPLGRLPSGRRVRRLLAVQGWPHRAQQDVFRGHAIQWAHVRAGRPGRVSQAPGRASLPGPQRRTPQVRSIYEFMEFN